MLSFFKNDAESKAVDSLLEGAKAILDTNIANGVYAPRKIGWFRLNIEDQPELDHAGEGIGDQMILSVEHGINRYVHYTRDGKSS